MVTWFREFASTRSLVDAESLAERAADEDVEVGLLGAKGHAPASGEQIIHGALLPASRRPARLVPATGDFSCRRGSGGT